MFLRTPWPNGAGLELHGPGPRLEAAYEELRDKGAIDFGWRGAEAMRISQGQARWGSDLACGDEASIERLGLIELAAEAPIPAGLEPVMVGEKLVGLTTSGAYDPKRHRVVSIATFDTKREASAKERVLINDELHEMRRVEQPITPVAR